MHSPVNKKQVMFAGDTESDQLQSYIVFNFFETLDPAPGFATFKDGFLHVAQVVREHDQFVYGLLLRDLNDNGRFPYVNYTLFGTDKHNVFHHDPSWVKVIREGHGMDQVHHQAGFEEYETIWPMGEPHVFSDRKPLNSETIYIITLFKADGDLDRLERSWRSWSGAEYILQSMPPDLSRNLRRVTFHRRIVPKGTFMYVLMCELTEVNEVLYRVRDFVNKLNERQCGHCAAYQIDQEFNQKKSHHNF